MKTMITGYMVAANWPSTFMVTPLGYNNVATKRQIRLAVNTINQIGNLHILRLHCSLEPSRACTNVQTPSGDNAQISWAQKCDPAKILAGQSELRSCTIV